MAAQGEKVIAQVLDSRRDQSEAESARLAKRRH
jgi:hypothetical protein